jgi:hypothetical protein
MRWEEHDETRNEYAVLIGKSEGKGSLVKHKFNGKII